MADSFDVSRDTAQQMVTACLHGDRDTAAALAEEHPDPLVLALVLADLTAYVHTRWVEARGLGTPTAFWQALMTGVEEWRSGAAGETAR